METVQITPLRRTLASYLNALVAVSKAIWAVKLCYSKILRFLTCGGASLHRLTYKIVV